MVNEDKPSRKGERKLNPRKLLGRVREAAESRAREGVERAGDLARKGSERAQDGAEALQRRVGEDYYAILQDNPVVTDTLSRVDLLTGDRALLQTAYNIPWTSTLMWSAAAGSAVTLQGPIAKVSGELFHYGPGHISSWDNVNKFMDSVAGRGHRLKFGHSIDYLPRIIEEFGVEAVPAFFMHLLQDFTTIDGIPIVPNAWNAKSWLQTGGLSAGTATKLVSVNFANVLAAVLVIRTVHQMWRTTNRNLKIRRSLAAARNAYQARDYSGAVVNLRQALSVERSPVTLIALGQTYMRRESDRMSAHLTFKEAMDSLAPNMDSTMSLGHARISTRGLAGIHCLATSDVLASIHPEHWDEHVRALVDATVFSFRSVASGQVNRRLGEIREVVSTPPYFSAAINHYLAAKAASYYPLNEVRQDEVSKNLESALGNLTGVTRSNPEDLTGDVDAIRRLWAMELLQGDDAETALARF